MRRTLRPNRLGHPRRVRLPCRVAQVDGQNPRVELMLVKRRGQRQTCIPFEAAEHPFGRLKRRERRGKKHRAARPLRLFQNILRRAEQKQFDPRGFFRSLRQHGIARIEPPRRVAPAGRQRKRLRRLRPRTAQERPVRRFQKPRHGRVQRLRRPFQPPGSEFLRPRRRLQCAYRRRQRPVERVLSAERLPRAAPKRAKLRHAHRRRSVILHARRELVRLVDEQRRAALHQRVDGHERIEHIVVIADDNVRLLRQRQRQFKRAERVLLRQRVELPASPVPAGQRLGQRVRQAVVKSLRIRTDPRAAVPLFHRADLVLRGDFHGQQPCAVRVQDGQRIHRALSARRSRRQHQHAGAFALAQRQRGGIQRGHRLADARRRLREEPLSLPDGDVHVRGERPLSRAIRAVGKREAEKRCVPRPPPRQQPLRPRAVGRAQRLKFALQPRAVRLLFIETNGRAVFIHI